MSFLVCLIEINSRKKKIQPISFNFKKNSMSVIIHLKVPFNQQKFTSSKYCMINRGPGFLAVI